jgi:hypothetical protein
MARLPLRQFLVHPHGMTEYEKNEAQTRQSPDGSGAKDNARASFLDQATHLLLDPVVSAVTSNRSTQEQVIESAKQFAKTVPLFMTGNVGRVALAALSVADEVKTKDTLGEGILDATLGLGKAAALSAVKSFAMARNVSPSMMGIELGITNRASDTGLTRSNYLDSNGQFDLAAGLQKTALTTFNPVALATDAATFAGADFAWGALKHVTVGTARYNPLLTHTLAGGVFGFSTGTGTEIAHQFSTGEFDASGLVLKAGLGTVTGLAGGAVGGFQTRRSIAIDTRETAADVAAARSTPFQKGEIVDSAQQLLRDGTFIPEVRTKGAYNIPFVFGKVVSPQGHEVPAVFRANDGSEVFARRMQSEIGIYGVDKRLRLDGGSPASVQRAIELDGKQVPGFIQEMRGKNLAQHLDSLVEGNNLSRANAKSLSQSDPALMSGLGDTMLKRMVAGEFDNHAMNVMVETNSATGARKVFGLDYDHVPSATNTLHFRPDPGRLLGWDNVGQRLYARLAGTEIGEQRLAKLNDFTTEYDTARGRAELQSLGFTRAQVDGMLGRANWFAENKYFPTSVEQPIFYLLRPMVRLLKPLIRGPEANKGPLVAPTL